MAELWALKDIFFKKLNMSKILKTGKIGIKWANFKWSYLGYFSTFLGSVKFLMGLNLLGLLMNMVTKPSGPTFVVRWSLNMGRCKIIKISRILKFLKNTEKRSSRFFLFSKSSYLLGFRPKKSPKKFYMFFATVRQSRYGLILTRRPFSGHSSLEPQLINSVRVAYESWSQEDSGKYWTISVGQRSPEI